MEYEWDNELSQALAGLTATTKNLLDAVVVVSEVTNKIKKELQEQENNVKKMKGELEVSQVEAVRMDEERKLYWEDVKKRVTANMDSKVVLDVGTPIFDCSFFHISYSCT